MQINAYQMCSGAHLEAAHPEHNVTPNPIHTGQGGSVANEFWNEDCEKDEKMEA